MPIAVFSYPEIRNEPDEFKLEFSFMPVLNFHFQTLELKKHNWRDYIKTNNPAAAALLSKMGYQKKERVQVKLEFLRMLVRMELDPARMTLLTGFFETYLHLDESEERKLEEELGKMDDKEVNKMMEITTSWEEKGKAKGIIEGQANILVKQLKKKFNELSTDLENRVRALPDDRLQELAESIFDFKTIKDVENFLS